MLRGKEVKGKEVKGKEARCTSVGLDLGRRKKERGHLDKGEINKCFIRKLSRGFAPQVCFKSYGF
jgi:hypothetical protein